MSATGRGGELQAAAARLQEIARLLRADETEDAIAVELAQEAARIAADVGGIAAEAAQAASEGGEPT